MADRNYSYFGDLKVPQGLRSSQMQQGILDFGKLSYFDLYESGYQFLIVCKIPTFIQKLIDTKGGNGVGQIPNHNPAEVQALLDNYIYCLEYEFRGLSGIEDITVDTLELTDGISSLNMIGKVNEQSASTVSMSFFEKSGAPLTKFNEYFLKGIKDSRSQAKTYHGLIDYTGFHPGYENEVFVFMYFTTDNTMTQIEQAYLLLNAQPTKAETSIFEGTKGDISHKEISMEFNCFAIKSMYINEKAKQMLGYMNDPKNINSSRLRKNSNEFNYTGAGKSSTDFSTAVENKYLPTT